jgi:hypothetical protein
VLLLLVAIMASWPTIARGDRIDRLIQILKSDPSYKVRMRVVIALGQLKNKRAVPPLIYALYDKNYTVRGLSAAALAQIGDKRGIYALRRVAKTDKHGFVRARAKAALRILERKATRPPPPVRYRFFIKVGKLVNRTGKGGKRPVKALEQALLRAFSGVPGVTTDLAGGKPTAAQLSRQRLRGFAIDGTLQRLKRVRTGRGLKLSCSIRVALTTFPGNSIKALYSGETSMEVGYYRPHMEDGLLRDLFEGAANEARRNIMARYLSHQ